MQVLGRDIVPFHSLFLGGLAKRLSTIILNLKKRSWDALSEKMFTSNNPFEAVKKRTDLNALEQMWLAIKLNQADEKQVELTRQAIPLLKNPKVLASMLESNRKFLCPYWQELIEEGQKDGSIQTQYPKELAEFLILMDLWLLPTIFPADEEGIHNRHKFIFQLLEKIGLPLLRSGDRQSAGIPSLFFQRTGRLTAAHFHNLPS